MRLLTCCAGSGGAAAVHDRERRGAEGKTETHEKLAGELFRLERAARACLLVVVQCCRFCYEYVIVPFDMVHRVSGNISVTLIALKSKSLYL